MATICDTTALEEALATLEKAARTFRPELLYPEDLDDLLDLVVRGERHLASMRTALAARIADTPEWERAGFTSAAAYLASRTGTSYGAAKDTIDTGRRLSDQPELADEFASGNVSAEQAREVAEAAERDPSAADELLDAAKRGTLKDLKDKAKDVKAKADADRLGRHEAQRRSRFHRSRVDRQGMVRGEYALPPEEGARLRAAIGDETRDRLRKAVKNGTPLTPDQASADALLHLVTGQDRPSGATRPKVIFRIDLSAYRRGRTRGDEVCDIVGIGPVPVEVVRQVIESDPFVAAVVSEGSDLRVAKSFGRHLKADVRAALEWAYSECSIETCDVSWGLEYDHWETDFKDSGVTGFFEVVPLCGPHHDLKTYRGYRLVGEPGRFRLVHPDEPDGSAPHQDPRAGPDPPG